jgi:8-amino-7-oxononanoate synthase
MSSGWERIEPRLVATADLLTRIDELDGLHHYLQHFDLDHDSPYVEVDGERYLMMSSYSYLGLNKDERIVTAAQEAAERYGTGAHGVRLLAGSLPIHDELESEMAELAGKPEAIVFSSGYVTNVGTIEALCGPDDLVLVDKVDHASIIDGCRLSGATMVRFRHNDPGHLARRLADADAEAASRSGAGGRGVRLVVVDSVYSMDGDIAPLPALREVCDEHGALLMVDEAHALGNIGRTGRGIEEHFGHTAAADITVGTLSKAIPSVGGFAAGPELLIQHLRYNARPFVFSAALPAPQAAAALAAVRILRAEPERVAHTQRLATRLRTSLTEAGFDTGHSESAVIPVIVGSSERAYALASACRREGVIGIPVATPAVPNGHARLRIAVTAVHSEADVDVAAKSLVAAGRACGILPA